jgi:hypothetical protein
MRAPAIHDQGGNIMQIWGSTPYATLSRRPDFVPPRPDDDSTKPLAGAPPLTPTPARNKPKYSKPKDGTSSKESVPSVKDTYRGLRPPPDKRASSPGKIQDVREQPPPQPAPDPLKRYPDVGQLAQRFLLLEENCEAIDLKPRDQLSIDDGLTLKEYDTLRDRLAFLRADGAAPDGGPVAMRRLAPADPAEPAQSPPGATPAKDDGGPQVRYIGGVRVRNDYSLKEVLDITSTALKSPFGSFIASSRDLVKKAAEGVALSADEEQKIYQYSQIVESFLTLSRAGRVQQAAGAAVDTLNSAIAGEPPSVQTMTDNIGQVQGLGDGLSPAPGAGRIVRKPVVPARPKASKASPSQEPPNLFDFPRFKIPPWNRSRAADAQPAFNPPVRLPTGRIGYRLSPTRPPRLPAKVDEGGGTAEKTGPRGKPVASTPKETGSGGEPLAGTPKETGLREEPVAGTSRETGPREEPVVATSRTKSDTPEESALRRASSDPQRKGSEAIASCTASSTGCVPTGAAPITIENAELDRLQGKGPFCVTLPLGPDEEQRRVNAFEVPFRYYRKDRDITGMSRGRRFQNTSYEMRRDVLRVGNGGDVTSYSPGAKVIMGHWGPHGASLAENINVIQLSNGKEGVGALKLRFADIPEGASVVVTGGVMSGCTMLFASDGHSLYAYHAGTSTPTAKWHTSTDGARSIVRAHQTIGPRSTTHDIWQDNNLDLVQVGRQYPFSALIYSGRRLANIDAVAAVGAIAGAVGAPDEAGLNAHLAARRHEYGPPDNRWHMMTFNYYEQNPQQPSVGTALAVVSRDMDGSVTLSVLAEKGNIDRRTSIGDPGEPISYRYTPVDSDSATCSLEKV